MIELRGVKKRYGEVEAVAGIDLAIREGELFGLIGHNGAGKTTLFKMMLGLVPPSAGELRIGGQAVQGEAFRQVRRGIGYLPESLALYENLSGLETLRFFARLKGAAPASCLPLLEKVGLGEAAAQRVRGYSKGMRQRLGFAQALLGTPRLLFLDEPTNGLDPQGILEFYRLLDELRGRGVTVILTSHILAEIQQRVDRLALIRDGRLQALGTVHSLRTERDLPLSVYIVLRPGVEGALQQALIPFGLAKIVIGDGVARFKCPRSAKRALLAVLAGLGEQLEDFELREPSLEDIFLGYAEDAA
ncbi:MAG: copper ABC transporter ATP-binding protein [Betaproteobacteria bacterium HGW-Betaproteobacteria-11]|nr:MAG: copper ABC transporter ATP-binding protein [Betaproteobacteria bacterium HGW-Betaproteobacteria-11]